VFGIGARRKVTAQSHSDRAGRDFGEAGSDDDPARGHCAGEPGRQRKGNGETVGHPDDDIADGGAGGEVGFLVTVMIVVIIVVMIGGGHFIPLERGPENQTRFLSGGSASIIMGQDLGKEKIIMTTPTAGAAPQGTFTVPALPYSFDALEPYIDAKTMEIHHDKHHGAYVTNLNKALDGHADLQKLSIEELVAHLDRVPENIRTAVRNNGGGHLNHSMFWKIMKKGGGGEPTGAVADAIRRSRAGLSDPNRPYGSFLFLGPTGVGKTELCKALAAFLFDSEDHLIRIDMSEFMEKHSVARLIGAPPGYVGYEEGGYLTELVRRKPYSVILLDEVEKAHPDVFNVLLQVLDDGRMTDGQGRTVDFKNTVIVMTSNLGSQVIQSMVGEPQEAVRDAVWEEVKLHFRPEFLNRIDDVVVFHALDRSNIQSIAKIQLQRLHERLAKLDMQLVVSDEALDLIGKVGYDPLFGARPLKRAIQQEIENPVAKLILAGKFGPKDVIPVEVEDGKLVFDRVVH